MSKTYRPKSPAFPVVVFEPTSEVDEGIDLRTYIASAAMAALLGNSDYVKQITRDNLVDGKTPPLTKSTAMVAVLAADALIAELNKETP